MLPCKRRGTRACWWYISLVLLADVANCQLSKPVAHDSHWQQQDNKFLQRKASNDKGEDDQKFDDVVGDNICPLDVELKWMTEISSSVYATPLITDLYADGRKDIIVPGFVHYTEVLEGPDGAKALGWPGFHKSTVHASPLLYDIDSDGIRDILVATYDGEIIFFKDNGELLPQRLQVPRLRVRKNWYVGLNPDPVDHSHPDVGKGQGADNPYEKAVHGGKQGLRTPPKAPAAAAKDAAVPAGGVQAPASTAPSTQQQHQQQQHQQPPPVPAAATQLGTAQAAGSAAGTAGSQPTQQHQPVQQQHQTQPQQQQPQQQQPAAQSPALNLAEADQAAVLKFRQHLKDYAKQFGQAAADDMLLKVKDTNRVMYDAIMAQIAKEKELELLVGSFGTATQQGQGPAAAAGTGQAGVAHQRRRLMSVLEEDEQGSSSTSTSSEAEELSAVRRRLLQEGGAAVGGAAAGNAGGVPGAAGVESDPTHKPLTQEALDSFKIFEDDAAAAAAAAGGGAGGTAGDAAAQQQPGAVQQPEDAAEAGEAAGVVSNDQEDDKEKDPYPYPYPSDASEYDELGDKWGQGVQQGQQGQQQQGAGGAAAGDAAGAGGAAAAGGQGPGDGTAAAQQHQQLHDLDDDLYGGGRWKDNMWDVEMFRQSTHQGDSEYVYVDAHVLCTPSIADIDGDGHEELVVAVSFFYDRDYYDDPSHAHELAGVDKDKYVAGGIVVFDLRTRVMKWQQHLDLTTTTTKFTAHMFSSPTLVDIDACGKMEIVVGTSVGFVYVLDYKGSSRSGWPIQMGEVQGQVLAADLNADGDIELFAGDSLGNVALLDINGKEIWERHIKSMIAQGAVAGDVDGDGLLEIVFGTADGKVHAIRGTDGRPIANFPFQTGGRIQAPATITHLKKGARHQHIMLMSFDGFLYLIDGKSGCAHTVDIGEASYAAVLVDDLCGDGNLELLVSTMNGNVYMLQTQMPYHPAKTWSSQVQGINGMVARWGYFGFVATADGRQLRDVAGQQLQVQVELWDARTILHNGLPLEDPPRGPYNITVVLKGVGVPEMNAGPQPVIGVSDVLDKPGKTVIEIPCPRTRTTAAVHLDVVTKHGLHFEDEFVVSFHMHFHKLLKWLIALPLLAMAAVVIVVGQSMGFDAGKPYHLG